MDRRRGNSPVQGNQPVGPRTYEANQELIMKIGKKFHLKPTDGRPWASSWRLLPHPNPGSFFSMIQDVVVDVQLMGTIAHAHFLASLAPKLSSPTLSLGLKRRMLFGMS